MSRSGSHRGSEERQRSRSRSRDFNARNAYAWIYRCPLGLKGKCHRKGGKLGTEYSRSAAEKCVIGHLKKSTVHMCSDTEARGLMRGTPECIEEWTKEEWEADGQSGTNLKDDKGTKWEANSWSSSSRAGHKTMAPAEVRRNLERIAKDLEGQCKRIQSEIEQTVHKITDDLEVQFKRLHREIETVSQNIPTDTDLA